jgi:hypothetical protein
MTCTQRSLNVLDAMVQKMEGGGRIEIADVKVLLTLLTAISQSAERRRLVDRIEESLAVRRGQDFVRNCRELAGLLRNQLNQEKDEVNGGLSNEVSTYFSRLERKYPPQPKEPSAAPAPGFRLWRRQ